MTWDFEAIRQPIAEKLVAGEGWWVTHEPYGMAFTHDQPSPYGPNRIWKNGVKHHPEIALVRASKEALRLAAVEMGTLPVCGKRSPRKPSARD